MRVKEWRHHEHESGARSQRNETNENRTKEGRFEFDLEANRFGQDSKTKRSGEWSPADQVEATRRDESEA